MLVGKNFKGVNVQLKPQKTLEIKDTPKQAEGQTKCGAVWNGTGGRIINMFEVKPGDVILTDDGAVKFIGFANVGGEAIFEKCEVEADDFESDRGDFRK